ncbi:MAG TPA: hypothetical protein ENK86_02735 [Campylobacterales bacterium]|nr:hypothetical protein [Campylobacterales bacterium]
MRVAIIGAGFSGCYLASKLTHDGMEVTLFEKSRGVGGRMATRYVDEHRINIGCHELSPIGWEFKQFCETMKRKKLLTSPSHENYSATAINGLLKSLASTSEVKTETRIETVRCINGEYDLIDSEGGHYPDFEALFITIPAPQLLDLTFDFETDIRKGIEKVTFDSVATMVLYGAKVKEISTHKLATLPNLRKLYQPSDEVLVIHMDRSFSNVHASLGKEKLATPMAQAIQTVLPSFELKDFRYFTHLWRYGFTEQALGSMYRFSPTQQIGIVADWMIGHRVEDAFRSVEAFVNASDYQTLLQVAQTEQIRKVCVNL